MKVGIIAMSAKPPTKGHFALIRIASRECDEVKLFVSLNDRKKKGQIPIYGIDMEELWRDVLEGSLPGNVDVTYVSDKTPVRSVYGFLGKANEDGSDDTYIVYSDHDDMQRNFPSQSLEKYLNDLYVRGKVQLEPVSRSETVDVSGTKMRQWLKDGEKDKFIEHLPEVLQDRGEQVWNMLQVSASVRR